MCLNANNVKPSIFSGNRLNSIWLHGFKSRDSTLSSCVEYRKPEGPLSLPFHKHGRDPRSPTSSQPSSTCWRAEGRTVTWGRGREHLQGGTVMASGHGPRSQLVNINLLKSAVEYFRPSAGQGERPGHPGPAGTAFSPADLTRHLRGDAGC